MPTFDCAVVILAYNGIDFTRRCLDSLLGGVDLPRQLFLVDNGSTDGTAGLIAESATPLRAAGIDLVTWRNPRNEGCSAARNRAWEQVAARYCVFMDNDAAVCTRSWLARLVAHLDADPQIGILGPKLIYPYRPHPIQCAGVAISRLGRVAFRGRGARRDDPRFARFETVHALISACWIMRTDLRDRIGYLDELFHPVQYEDLDLCLRAAGAGYRVAYAPDVEMYHFEGITTEALGQADYRRNIARNSLKFRERWHGVFSSYADDLPADAYRWRPRSELGLTADLDLSVRDA